MKPRPAAMVVLLLAVVVFIRFPLHTLAQQPASLQTSQPLYTLRDTQVVLQGSGYQPKKDYVIWLQTPPDNSTRNTGVSFSTTEKGEIPLATSVPIKPDSPLGTYLVSISNSTTVDAAVALAHYGIWGTSKYVYQRTEIVEARGGGILPKAALKVTFRDPAGTDAYKATVAANETGAFLTTWKIPPTAPTEEYTVFVDGTGTYDSPAAEFVSKSKFSVTPALLNVTVLTQPTGPYERMRTVSAEFVVVYPDSTAVVTMKEGLKPAALYAGQFKSTDISLIPSTATSGVWIAQSKIPRNATLNVKYKFLLPAKAFDDGNGNIGSETDVETNSFNVTAATLQVSVKLNATHYQVPFETITAYAQVSYPDGTPVTDATNATVAGRLTAVNSRANATVAYDSAASVWVLKYAFGWGDLLSPGAWTLSVEARDIYGNSGSSSVEVIAEPYTFLEILLAVVIILLVARWLISRFWRRLYIGAKRISAAIRGRLKPSPIGRYFSHSPVTPWIRSSLSRPRYLYLKT